METEWLILIFAGAIVLVAVVGAIFGINFDIVLQTLREFLQSIREKAKENREAKKQGKNK
jgi:hypothetical protein